MPWWSSSPGSEVARRSSSCLPAAPGPLQGAARDPLRDSLPRAGPGKILRRSCASRSGRAWRRASTDRAGLPGRGPARAYRLRACYGQELAEREQDVRRALGEPGQTTVPRTRRRAMSGERGKARRLEPGQLVGPDPYSMCTSREAPADARGSAEGRDPLHEAAVVRAERAFGGAPRRGRPREGPAPADWIAASSSERRRNADRPPVVRRHPSRSGLPARAEAGAAGSFGVRFRYAWRQIPTFGCAAGGARRARSSGRRTRSLPCPAHSQVPGIVARLASASRWRKQASASMSRPQLGLA